MHYYQFDIGLYKRDTGHLTRLEHSIYRDLIDLYYLEENPLGYDWVIRRLGLVSEEEVESLKNVLNDFFIPENNLWKHKKIELDLKKYKDNSTKNKENGKKGGRPKSLPELKKTQSVFLGNPNETQEKPNYNPTERQFNNLEIYKFNNLEINTQKENTKEKVENLDGLSVPENPSVTCEVKDKGIALAKKASVSRSLRSHANCAKPEGVSSQLWEDFIMICKAKNKPMSDTVLRSMTKQAELAGRTMEEVLTICCEKGWSRFKEEWMHRDEELSKTGQMNKRVLSGLTRGLSDRLANASASNFSHQKSASQSGNGLIQGSGALEWIFNSDKTDV